MVLQRVGTDRLYDERPRPQGKRLDERGGDRCSDECKVGEHVERDLKAVRERGAAERGQRPAVGVVAVAVAVIVVSAAKPIEQWTCRLVLISPEATPASAGRTPVSPAIITGTNEKASPTPLTIRAGKTFQK